VFLKFRPHALYAFPSYVSELIDYCESESIHLLPLRVVFTSSEVLTDQLRNRISAFFNARVCDVYGCAEFKEIAWECNQGQHHINFESMYVESISNDDGEKPSLIVTSLTNRAMPLLRYRIGDFGQVRDQPCSCGRQSPWIDSIAGREVDILILPSGRRVSPYVLINESIDQCRDILKHQFVQTAPDRLEIRVSMAKGGRSIGELQHLVQDVAARLDGEMDVAMVDVRRIPRTIGGKHRVLIRAADAADAAER
jgi:phenylacetate-CoA ligase